MRQLGLRHGFEPVGPNTFGQESEAGFKKVAAALMD